MSKQIETINRSIDDLIGFLKRFIYPFATPFFAILNYPKMRDLLIKNHHKNWANFALVLSIIYIAFTLGFGIYWVIKG